MRYALLLVVLLSCDYAKKVKRSEAQVHLDQISKLAKTQAIAKGKYPAGNTGVTPAVDCCKQPEVKCQPDPAAWSAAPWRELDFHIDEPHHYRYSYESDGNTFTAKAVGDLDCDMNEITYGTVTGKLVDGAPSVVIDMTPSGTD